MMTTTRPLPIALGAVFLLLGALALLLPARASAQDAGGVTITVGVSLPAEDHSTPRDWYFEITDAGGEVADTLTISTTEGAPAGVVTRSLPAGDYTVHYRFNNQVTETCGNASFFALASPASVTSSVTGDGTAMDVRYSFEGCPGAPEELGSTIQYSASNHAPVSGASTEDDVSATYVDEGEPTSASSSTADSVPVSGAAESSTGTRFSTAPLAPDTGTGLAPAEGTAWLAPLLVLALASAGGAAARVCRALRNRA